MTEERILALDVSSKTGYAFMISKGADLILEEYGTLPQIHEPLGWYPSNYVCWAYEVFGSIKTLIDKYRPEVLVIEETVAGSKAVYSQKFLEWSHFLLAQYIKDSGIKSAYLLTGAWRSEVSAKMTKEESKHNKAVKEYKEKNNSKYAYDTKGKRIGKLTKKHINVRRANEVFGAFLKKPLKKKDEDTCDALLLGYAYHLRRQKGYKVVPEIDMELLLKDNSNE